MTTFQLKIGIAALLMVVVFIFGFWLSHSGKPYSTILMTVHKLAALAALILLLVMVNQVQRVTPLNSAQIFLLVVMIVCFICTIVTGGLVSIDKALPAFVSTLHKISPYLVLLSIVAMLYKIR